MHLKQLPLDLEPTVENRQLMLVQLFIAVTRLDGYKNVCAPGLWQQVAFFVGFPPQQWASAAMQLKTVYEPKLFKFVEDWAESQRSNAGDHAAGNDHNEEDHGISLQNSCVRCLERRVQRDGNVPCIICTLASAECRHPPDLVCAQYGRAFDQVHKLNDHKRYHQKSHECHHPGCGKKFYTKTHLDRHTNEEHGKGQRRFHCPELSCAYAVGGKGFPRLDNWKRHVLRKHLLNPESYASQKLVSFERDSRLYSRQELESADRPTISATPFDWTLDVEAERFANYPFGDGTEDYLNLG
ncbi:hypothetical protein GGR57DRAFT_462487 [Xylariaceae sp. FL1272]|nr:hypothetical protein GGR57DRAFT_462487 [Xylariaceae sp. FL1272]